MGMGMMGGGQMPHSPMYQMERQLGIKHGPAHEMEKGDMFNEHPNQPNQPGQQPGAPGQPPSVPQQVPQTPMLGGAGQPGATNAGATSVAGGMGMAMPPQQGGMSAGV